MAKNFWIFLLMLVPALANAQSSDTIFAVRKGSGLAIKYSLKSRETVNMIARRYFSTQEKIESSSMVDARKTLAVGTELYIPLVQKANYYSTKEPFGIQHEEPVYYKVREKDDIALISLLDNIEKKDLVLWNNLKGNTLQIGQRLFLGWVKVFERDTLGVNDGVAYPSLRKSGAVKTVVDTSRHAFGELDSLYNAQTKNGTNTIVEKGTAVFFDKAGSNKVFYAFHSTTQPGAVIKIHNPGTDKTILVKVLAPLPNTKLYSNSVIGISSAAKDALGVNEKSCWVELTYCPN